LRDVRIKRSVRKRIAKGIAETPQIIRKTLRIL